MLIDTHTHLYLKQFDEDRDAMIQRAIEAGVLKMYLPNIDASSIESMIELESKYPDHCFAMMGLHPTSVKENYEEELDIVKRWLDKRKFVAIGEIGIDLYWDKTFFKQQEEAFLQQIEWSIEYQLPFIIHSRESMDILIDRLADFKNSDLWGVFHCFTGDLGQAKKILDMGLYLGLGGVLTFKNSGLDIVTKSLPLDRLVLETDAPYLSPVPFRGKRNESAYIRHVAEKLASIKNLSFKVIEEITSTNAKNLFLERK